MTMTMPTPLSLLPLLLAFSLLHPTPTVGYSGPNPTPTTNTDFIRTSCGNTLYPDLCYTSLSRYANAVQSDPARLARASIGVSLSKARRVVSYLSNVSRQVDYSSDHRSSAVVHDCLSVFGDAVSQMRGSVKQMLRLGHGTGSLQFQLSNVQTWMSAALTNEDTCTDGFEDVSDRQLKTDVCDRVVKVKEVTSNALALINSFVSKVTPP